MTFWIVALGVLKVVQQVLRTPLVDKAIDNLVAGTTNKIDDAVWSAIEAACGAAPSPEVIKERAPEIKEKLAVVQSWYDDLAGGEKLYVKKPEWLISNSKIGINPADPFRLEIPQGGI